MLYGFSKVFSHIYFLTYILVVTNLVIKRTLHLVDSILGFWLLETLNCWKLYCLFNASMVPREQHSKLELPFWKTLNLWINLSIHLRVNLLGPTDM